MNSIPAAAPNTSFKRYPEVPKTRVQPSADAGFLLNNEKQPLTDAKCRNAKFKYRFNGKENLLTKLGLGRVVVLYHQLQRSVDLPMSDYIAHKIGIRAHP